MANVSAFSDYKNIQKQENGYLHPCYVQSLADFGTPRELPQCKGWVLERKIPGWPYRDAMGCYPIFSCKDWSKLNSDLEGIGTDLVSVSLVTDPFGDYDVSDLHECFKGIVVPFKEHFVIELGQSLENFVHKHHIRNAKKSLKKVDVVRCGEPAQHLDDWIELYSTLITRHGIKGIPAFSSTALSRQLDLPGAIVFRGVCKDTTVGMMIWYVQSDVGYYHLGAYSLLGYELGASFALFWSSIKFFTACGLRWLNLGAGAGIKNTSDDGLSRFKRGWSTGTRTTYLCGHIFDYVKYKTIVATNGISNAEYFPAYRIGEFK